MGNRAACAPVKAPGARTRLAGQVLEAAAGAARRVGTVVEMKAIVKRVGVRVCVGERQWWWGWMRSDEGLGKGRS